ncbi:hypothetical protein [Nannocystis punicea]|uniref:Uncharacterized protein n=1 Tax=Nannocystis punicea TaxID=2995304 RepID=A0ABY7HHR8_9BACT|nr:hypothetical protein [Nannocystis poenicansa]WAS98856.1 hypothetical protein O0S08_22220 [Nannocystis poenicansa]
MPASLLHATGGPRAHGSVPEDISIRRLASYGHDDLSLETAPCPP